MMDTDTALQRIGRYELRERLGRNNLAESWRAYDPRRRCDVALKLLAANTRDHPDFSLRFSHEIEVIASLHHPNVVQLHEAQLIPMRRPDTALAYIVSDFIEGQTLTSYLQHMPRMGMMTPWAEIVQIFTQVAMAVDYAHQNGVLHGNLKPSNVILGRVFRSSGPGIAPIVTDFGLAQVLGITAGLVPHRTTEALFYISPEQAKGHSATERSDIYSLGVLLYEICTGVVPFQGNRPVALMMQHASATPQPPALINPNIPPALTQVIMRSLAKDPTDRFTTASSMAIALTKALNLPIPERLNHLVTQADNDRPMNQMNQMNQANQTSEGWTPSPPIHSGSYGVAATPPEQQRQEFEKKSRQPSLATVPPLARRRAKRRKEQTVFIALGVLLLLTMVVTGLGGYVLLHGQAAPASTVVGHAFFASSGQLNEHSSTQGINDELQIDLSGLAGPASGKSYYAWLLPDKTQEEALPIFLGKLPVNHGTVHFLYVGGNSHINLLNVTSRFLITEEDASIAPTIPTPDTHAWRYYAELAQAASPADKLHFSMLDHLRHLLVESPELQARGLRGGLVIWLVQNTQKAFDLSSSARGTWQAKDYATARAQLTSLMDYLDGNALTHTELPAGAPPLVDQQNATIPLLGLDPRNPDPPGYAYNNENSPGYVYLIGLHLSGMLLAPDVTPDQRTLAFRVDNALKSVDHSLALVRSDALKLLQLTAPQFGQPTTLALFNDLTTQAQTAYAGQIDQTSGQPQGGMIWIYGNIQRLADFVVKPYTP